MAEGEGEAGREDCAGADSDTDLVFDGLRSASTGAGEIDIDFASSIPPPEVTNGLSAVFFRQNDHFGLVSSP